MMTIASKEVSECQKTFQFILSCIHHTLKRQTLCEEPISPAFRSGLSLYRLHMYSVSFAHEEQKSIFGINKAII